MKTDVKPWLYLYPEGVPAHLEIMDQDLISAWRHRVRKNPHATAVLYFDGKLTARELDDASDALAVALIDLGVERGDHVGLYMQNVPAYPVTMLALWKLGAAALVLNPMYKKRELRHLID